MPDRTVVTQVDQSPSETSAARPPLWMQLEDRAVFGSVRLHTPCPAVFVLKHDHHVFLAEQYQYYLRAINYNMALEDVYLLLDYRLPFASHTGFRHPNYARADWFHRRDLTQEPPQLDKVHTTSRSVLTGSPGYRLGVALRQAFVEIRQTIDGFKSFARLRRSIRKRLTTRNVLRVTTFDSGTPPALKPGMPYPARMEDVDPDAYLYMPRTHPWMFYAASIVNRSTEVVPFPHGGVYSWAEDGAPRSFLPHIANSTFGPVDYELGKLRRLSETEPIPCPYRTISSPVWNGALRAE